MAHTPNIVADAWIDAEHVEFTNTSLRRFMQLVRPTLDGQSVEPELMRVLDACARLVPERPAWAGPVDEEHRDPEFEEYAEAWLMLGDDIAFPIVEGRAITCITRNSGPDSARRERSQFRREATERRQVEQGYGPHDRTAGMYRRRLCRLRREIDEALAPSADEWP